MKKLLSCEFNMDTACVELRYIDGTMISIDVVGVENEVAENLYQKEESGFSRSLRREREEPLI